MTDYSLIEILLGMHLFHITFLAVLANASAWIEIAQSGKETKRWLRKFLRLKNGIPSHGTFRRVFSLIDGDTLQKATVNFLVENMAAFLHCVGAPEDGDRLVCVDGKEERGPAGNTARQRRYATSRRCMSMMPQMPSVSVPTLSIQKQMRSQWHRGS